MRVTLDVFSGRPIQVGTYPRRILRNWLISWRTERCHQSMRSNQFWVFADIFSRLNPMTCPALACRMTFV